MPPKYARKLDKNHYECFDAAASWLIMHKFNVQLFDTASFGHGMPDFVINFHNKPLNIVFVEVKNPKEYWKLTPAEIAFALRFKENYIIVESAADVHQDLDFFFYHAEHYPPFSALSLVMTMNRERTTTVYKAFLDEYRKAYLK